MSYEIEDLQDISRDIYVSDELIILLKTVYQDSVINIQDQRELDYAKGQQSVISFLESVIEQQQDK